MFYTGVDAEGGSFGASSKPSGVVLDERARRLVAAAEAEAMGFGGVTAVAEASGLSRGTLMRGLAELQTAPKLLRGQPIRRKGGGRKRTAEKDTTLRRDLEPLVEPEIGWSIAAGQQGAGNSGGTNIRRRGEIVFRCR